MPSVLAHPTPPTPRSSITPPPMPRKTVRAMPPVPSAARKITPPVLDTAPVKPRQTASLPPSGGKTGTTNMVRLGFESGQAKLPAPAIKQLDGVVRKLTKESALRLQLLAYAGGATSSGSQARRLSLSRALAVRSYLIEKGIRSTRIDVRALGNQVKGSPADRVDVIINNR
ncbi:MAG: OmpA family protein [Rhodospirillales bacterium]|nr:OmpA family protein [Rhodospirillales bacterium]